MKILCFSQIFPSSTEPSRGPYNLNVFSSLATDGNEVVVVAPRPWWRRVQQPLHLLTMPSESYRGLQVDYPTYWSIPGATQFHGENMYASLKGYMADLRKQFAFDCIFAAWAYPDGYAAARFGELFDCPIVTKVMGSDINELTKIPKLAKGLTLSLQNCDRIIAVSGKLRDTVSDFGIDGDKVTVINNGVDGQKFTIRDKAHARAQLALPLHGNIIAFVGRLGFEKGADIFVEALGEIKRKSLLNFTAVIVGWGQEESTLQARASVLGLSDSVLFVGRKSHEEIAQYLAACDVFCLSSRREGCPNVVLEALASGRPVVATNVGGVPELIDESNGIITEPENARDLARGLTEALRLDWSAEALRKSVRSLSWSDVGEHYLKTLENVVAAHRPRGTASLISIGPANAEKAVQ